MSIGLIGHGAIAAHVAAALEAEGLRPQAILARRGRETAAQAALGCAAYSDAARFARGLTLAVDCAGHAGLRAHGSALLRAGVDVVTLSVGALADDALSADLAAAAKTGGAVLELASGAIGSLDALAAAATGGLAEVRYTGRKPPAGWAGSAAEQALDLTTLTTAAVHFEGSAREAALKYPANANVAAAVALAGMGFDATHVTLIADPDAPGNIHEIDASGAFGSLSFRITGHSLPGAPRSSALAAMSAVRAVLRRRGQIRF